MLSGITQKTLGRYQEATKMVEETMSRLASGTADIGSALSFSHWCIGRCAIPVDMHNELS